MMHVVRACRFSPHGRIVVFACGRSMRTDDEPEPVVGDGAFCDGCLKACDEAGVTLAG